MKYQTSDAWDRIAECYRLGNGHPPADAEFEGFEGGEDLSSQQVERIVAGVAGGAPPPRPKTAVAPGAADAEIAADVQALRAGSVPIGGTAPAALFRDRGDEDADVEARLEELRRRALGGDAGGESPGGGGGDA